VADEFLTDDQEAERARQWLRENGLYIAAGVLLGLGGLFGWQAWEDSQNEQAEKASIVWGQLRNAIDGERYNEAEETLAILEDEYASTPYLEQARLFMARMYMDQRQPDMAMEQLSILEMKGKDAELKQVAKVRRSQILVSEERYEEVLELLGPEASGGVSSLQHELRGDALFALGEFEAAREAYQKALDTDAGGVIDRNFVQMKLDDVAVSLSSSSAAQTDPVAELTGAAEELTEAAE